MKDKTIAIAMWISIALIIIGFATIELTGYIRETETEVNKERVRFQDY